MAQTPYTPIGWLNDQAPAINQTNLNKMDNELVYLDGQVDDIHDEFNEIGEEYFEHGIAPLDISSGFTRYSYIQIPTTASIGDTIDLSPTFGAAMAHQVVTCNAGDVFVASGRATSGYAGMGFVDNDNKLVFKSDVIYSNLRYVCPSAGKLILNANINSTYYALKGEWISDVFYREDAINKKGIAFNEDCIKRGIGNIFYELKSGYIQTGANTNVKNPPVYTSTTDMYAFIPCNPGDVITIKGHSTSSNSKRMWQFVNSTGVRLTYSGVSLSYDDYVEILAPASAAYMLFNVVKANDYALIKGRLIRSILDNKKYNIPGLVWEAGYVTKNGAKPSGNNYTRTAQFLLKAGQTIYIKAEMRVATGASLTQWTEAGTFVQSLIYGIVAAGETVSYTAQNDIYVIVSRYTSATDTFEFRDPTSIDADKYASQNAKAIKQSLYEWERILNSICCIGDSLTKGAYYVNGHDGSAISQNYPFFFSKQSGVPVQNEGQSGSSPSSRWSYFSTFDFTPYNAFFIWWGTNGGLTDTLQTDGVIDGDGNLIEDYTTYSDTNTGDYCKVIGRIIQQVPHAKIFLANIYTTTGDVTITNQVISKIADLYPDNVMGIIQMNNGDVQSKADAYLTPSYVHKDNITHFSMTGNYYLAVHWIRSVRNIIAADPGKFEDMMEDIIGG